MCGMVHSPLLQQQQQQCTSLLLLLLLSMQQPKHHCSTFSRLKASQPPPAADVNNARNAQAAAPDACSAPNPRIAPGAQSANKARNAGSVFRELNARIAAPNAHMQALQPLTQFAQCAQCTTQCARRSRRSTCTCTAAGCSMNPMQAAHPGSRPHALCQPQGASASLSLKQHYRQALNLLTVFNTSQHQFKVDPSKLRPLSSAWDSCCAGPCTDPMQYRCGGCCSIWGALVLLQHLQQQASEQQLSVSTAEVHGTHMLWLLDNSEIQKCVTVSSSWRQLDAG
jgi:hypothetical protein